MTGLAQGPLVASALTLAALPIEGWVWHWLPGDAGGEYPEHRVRDGETVHDLDGWTHDADHGTLPGTGPNRAHCRCYAHWVVRDRDGRFRDQLGKWRKFVPRVDDDLSD